MEFVKREEEFMKDLDEILKIAIITIIGKLGAAWSLSFSMPTVIGFLAVGFILGPSVLGIIHADKVIHTMSDIGVIIILFLAGMETDLDQLKRQAKDALLAATGGVTLPFVFALLILPFVKYSFTQSLLMGTVLTATSVSISVQVLAEMKKLRSKEGATILGAAIADDVMGILILTFVITFIGEEGKNPYFSFIYILIYFILGFYLGKKFLPYFFKWTSRFKLKYMIPTMAIGIMFFYAWLAHHLGAAYITGAYLAGLVLGTTHYRQVIHEIADILGADFFSIMFFVTIGLEADIKDFRWASIIDLVIILSIAIFGKLIGSGGGVFILGYKPIEAIRVGVGMIPRGEVALVVAAMALRYNIFNSYQFSSVVATVLITAFLTPIVLKKVFSLEDIGNLRGKIGIKKS